MEVVSNSLDQNTQINDSNTLYKQNKYNVYPCTFENRDQTFKQKSNNLLLPNEFVSIDYVHPKPQFVDESEDMSVPNTDNLLVNTNNIVIESNMIPMSQKYTTSENEVNFQTKNFNKIDGSESLSVTQDSTYSNDKFWKEVYPEITTNNNFLHKIVDINHLKSRDEIDIHEGYNQDFNLEHDHTLNMNKNMQYHKHPNKNIFREEPKASQNYKTNYTKVDNKIVHSGIANKSNKKMYTQKDNIYSGDKSYGQINYYNEGWLDRFNNEFMLNQKMYNYIDPNQNNYDKYVCNEEHTVSKNVADCVYNGAYNQESFRYVPVKQGDPPVTETSKQDDYNMNKSCDLYHQVQDTYQDPICENVQRNAHEYNIMLKRNENLIASLNQKENQFRRI